MRRLPSLVCLVVCLSASGLQAAEKPLVIDLWPGKMPPGDNAA